jgi:lipoprotein-anchoring transpeptidase ErfK/SrfK
MSRVAALARRGAFVSIAGLLAMAGAWAPVGEPSPPKVRIESRRHDAFAAVPNDPIRSGTSLAATPGRSPRPALLVEVVRDLSITAKPGGGQVIGSMPAASPQFGFRTYAWVLSVSPNGRFGRVPVPYSRRGGTGWIPLRGLHRLHTAVTVQADLSRHQITVERLGKVILRMKAATGSAGSPTPPGRYFITDRVPFSPSSPYGTFAFGISSYQFHIPPGWHGGSQLAIHGTNDAASIGRSVSTGCLRVSERSLALLKPLLRLGTPVIIRP